jgi:DNA-binding LacI/PurR family transcriptional regulator
LEGKNLPLVEGLVIDGEGTLASGIKAAEQILGMPQPPTAIFCFNDLTAIGLIRGLVQADAQVPRDYSVVGFDDLEMASYYCPPLTTVHQPTHRLGQCAINMLLKLIREESDPQPECLPAKLVIRESTGPAAKKR